MNSPVWCHVHRFSDLFATMSLCRELTMTKAAIEVATKNEVPTSFHVVHGDTSLFFHVRLRHMTGTGSAWPAIRIQPGTHDTWRRPEEFLYSFAAPATRWEQHCTSTNHSSIAQSRLTRAVGACMKVWRSRSRTLKRGDDRKMIGEEMRFSPS